MRFRDAAQEVVDAEFTDVGAPPVQVKPPRPGIININEVTAAHPGAIGPGEQQFIIPLADEQKIRAVALFIKVPFFAYIALNSKVPTLIRAGAALLCGWEAIQIARSADAIENMLPREMNL